MRTARPRERRAARRPHTRSVNGVRDGGTLARAPAAAGLGGFGGARGDARRRTLFRARAAAPTPRTQTKGTPVIHQKVHLLIPCYDFSFL